MVYGYGITGRITAMDNGSMTSPSQIVPDARKGLFGMLIGQKHDNMASHNNILATAFPFYLMCGDVVVLTHKPLYILLRYLSLG